MASSGWPVGKSWRWSDTRPSRPIWSTALSKVSLSASGPARWGRSLSNVIGAPVDVAGSAFAIASRICLDESPAPAAAAGTWPDWLEWLNVGPAPLPLGVSVVPVLAIAPEFEGFASGFRLGRERSRLIPVDTFGSFGSGFDGSPPRSNSSAWSSSSTTASPSSFSRTRRRLGSTARDSANSRAARGVANFRAPSWSRPPIASAVCLSRLQCSGFIVDGCTPYSGGLPGTACSRTWTLPKTFVGTVWTTREPSAGPSARDGALPGVADFNFAPEAAWGAAGGDLREGRVPARFRFTMSASMALRSDLSTARSVGDSSLAGGAGRA
jgi:hypothetical protein